MNEYTPQHEEQKSKSEELEDLILSQARIILAELKAARNLAHRLKQNPELITKPYLDMLSKHYERMNNTY